MYLFRWKENTATETGAFPFQAPALPLPLSTCYLQSTVQKSTDEFSHLTAKCHPSHGTAETSEQQRNETTHLRSQSRSRAEESSQPPGTCVGTLHCSGLLLTLAILTAGQEELRFAATEISTEAEDRFRLYLPRIICSLDADRTGGFWALRLFPLPVTLQPT